MPGQHNFELLGEVFQYLSWGSVVHMHIQVWESRKYWPFQTPISLCWLINHDDTELMKNVGRIYIIMCAM